MRPRKPVLVYCTDADTLGRLRYMLETRLSVRVSPASTATAALEAIEERAARGEDFMAVLAVRDLLSDNVLAKAFVNGIPTVEARTEFQEPDLRATYCVVLSQAITLIDALKTSLARRRGPRRAALRQPSTQAIA